MSAQLVVGIHAVRTALKHGAQRIDRLWFDSARRDRRLRQLLDEARAAGLRAEASDKAALDRMTGGANHQGVVAQGEMPASLGEAALDEILTALEHPPLLLVLDGVTDPHNLGACLRTADAAGVDAVVVPRHGAAGLGPTVSKVAAGAAESIPFAAVSNTGKTLVWIKEYGIAIIGTSDAGDESLYDADLSGSLALVMGQEHAGLRKNIAARCDRLVSLPMHGTVSSLNVSVATGICLYEARRQRAASLIAGAASA